MIKVWFVAGELVVYKYLIGLLCIITCYGAQGVEVKKVQINGVDIAYYIRGSGDPLFMVMGFRGTMAAWDPAFIDQLAKHYQVILFDNRGAGLSTDTEEDDTTLEQMANDTVGLIKALGFEKVHLLGWSMGSMIAMQLAIDYPEVLKTLILCSPNPGGRYSVLLPNENDTREKLKSSELSLEKGLSLIFPSTERGLIAAGEYAARLAEAILIGKIPDNLIVSPQTVDRQVNALRLKSKDNTMFEKLASLKVPTLVGGGLKDVLDSPENARQVACQIPFAWSAYFPNAGHAFLSQEHANFAQLIEIFISSQ